VKEIRKLIKKESYAEKTKEDIKKESKYLILPPFWEYS
jgi:hypothetical protein